MLKIGHTVKVRKELRGESPKAEPEVVAVPEELETVPGIPTNDETVSYYARHYPIESHAVENFVYRKWSREVSDIKETRDEHDRLMKPFVQEAAVSGDLEPTAEPVPGKDMTKEIKDKALEIGFSMVGTTAYDSRYTYKSKRKWVKPYPNAICLAVEQPYEETQTIPSEPAERAVFATYRWGGEKGLELGNYIRSLGYHAQVNNPVDPGSALLPMFVQAGMGQMGASGYLLSPHFGSRVRLMYITTDAPVTFDKPEDFGIQSFCNICQVCVNRCPGRALSREQVWWRGVNKFKVVASRCRPVMARYAACGVCMKVCPVQRYGVKSVMDHYAATGQVLGKGTHQLEGYEMRDMGYFGPGELPRFDAEFFDIPEGSAGEYLLQDMQMKIAAGKIPEGPEGDKMWREFRVELEEAIKGPKDSIRGTYEVEHDIDEF